MESRHIRELAMFGFKDRLKKYGEEVFMSLKHITNIT